MLKGKLIALTGALAFMVMAQTAGAANIGIQGGDISPQSGSNIVVLNHTWRIETTESVEAWAWSISCTGCQIVAYNMNYAFGAPSGPPNGTSTVQWQAPGYSALTTTLPAFVYANNGSEAGSIGGASAGGAFVGNGLDVLIGWVTVHVTATSGSVTPFVTPFLEGIAFGGLIIPTTFSAVTWSPEPGTAMLIALGLGGLGVMGRRNR
jgi:hypothetical protein